MNKFRSGPQILTFSLDDYKFQIKPNQLTDSSPLIWAVFSSFFHHILQSFRRLRLLDSLLRI